MSVDINFRDVHDLSSFPNLRILMLPSCKLRGIPSFLRNQSTLLHLDLADNEIVGLIPHWILENEHLGHLNLSKNFLTRFEGSFWNLSSNLLLLDLSFNQLQGPFPFIPTLVVLDYSNNRFNSIIPLDIGNRLPFIFMLSFSTKVSLDVRIQLPLPTKVNKWSWSESKRSSRTWICRATILRVQYQMS